MINEYYKVLVTYANGSKFFQGELVQQLSNGFDDNLYQSLERPNEKWFLINKNVERSKWNGPEKISEPVKSRLELIGD